MNQIGDAGIMQLADALQNNQVLFISIVSLYRSGIVLFIITDTYCTRSQI
jgi:hypothetical protein